MHGITKGDVLRTLSAAAAFWALLCVAHVSLLRAADPATMTLAPRVRTTNPNTKYSKSLDRTLPVRPIAVWDAKMGLRSRFGELGGVVGERIEVVQVGSLADRMNLEVGDIIISVNGAALRNAESWEKAVERVSRLGGWLTLKVRRESTGAILYRTANLKSYGR